MKICFPTAIKYYEYSLVTYLEKLRPKHIHVAATYNNFGSVRQVLGDFERAKEYHHHALNIYLKKLGPDHVDVAATYNNLGSVHQVLGDFEQAKEHHHHALNMYLKNTDLSMFMLQLLTITWALFTRF